MGEPDGTGAERGWISARIKAQSPDRPARGGIRARSVYRPKGCRYSAASRYSPLLIIQVSIMSNTTEEYLT